MRSTFLALLVSLSLFHSNEATNNESKVVQIHDREVVSQFSNFMLEASETKFFLDALSAPNLSSLDQLDVANMFIANGFQSPALERYAQAIVKMIRASTPPPTMSPTLYEEEEEFGIDDDEIDETRDDDDEGDIDTLEEMYASKNIDPVEQQTEVTSGYRTVDLIATILLFSCVGCYACVTLRKTSLGRRRFGNNVYMRPVDQNRTTVESNDVMTSIKENNEEEYDGDHV